MKQITVVEDDPDLKHLIAIALKSNGYEVNIQNEWTGLPEILADLYILDINLGNGMDGIDICKQLKSRSSGTKTPFVILVSANPDLRRMAVEACADATLTKPFTTHELLQKVSAYLRDTTAI